MIEAKRLQFPIEGYSTIGYDINNIDSMNKVSYLIAMPMFVKDTENNYYLRHGVHLVPIDKLRVENTISDFNKYFNGNFEEEQGCNILNRRLNELNNHIKTFIFD